MAQRPLRPCRHPGCIALTREGWCPQHKPKHKRGECESWHRLYSLPGWARLRTDQLTREPWCAECTRAGRKRTRATVVDHIVPHRGDLRLFADPGNLQSLCKRCHDRKTLQERRERQNRGGSSGE